MIPSSYALESKMGKSSNHSIVISGFGRQGGRQDIGGGVQIALGMAADQLPVFGKGDIAFEDTGTHPGSGLVGFAAVFRKLQRRSAMADGKIAHMEFVLLVGALAESGFQGAVSHLPDQVVGAGAWSGRLIGVERPFGLGCLSLTSRKDQ